MNKEPKKTRKFDGKRYKYYVTYDTKAEAQRVAKRQRKRATMGGGVPYLTRVVKTSQGYTIYRYRDKKYG